MLSLGCVRVQPLSPHQCGYYSSCHSLDRAEEHRQEHNEATQSDLSSVVTGTFPTIKAAGHELRCLA